jgi:hypothetical protein
MGRFAEFGKTLAPTAVFCYDLAFSKVATRFPYFTDLFLAKFTALWCCPETRLVQNGSYEHMDA